MTYFKRKYEGQRVGPMVKEAAAFPRKGIRKHAGVTNHVLSRHSKITTNINDGSILFICPSIPDQHHRPGHFDNAANMFML